MTLAYPIPDDDREEDVMDDELAAPYELAGSPQCSDCGKRTEELVTTRGGCRVCRDCYMGENWED